MKDYIYLINKKSGISSFKAINNLKFENKEKISKIGHAGTLDPMASGLMITMINGATKLSDILMHQDKVYNVYMILGYETDTLDLEGKITNVSDNISLDNKVIEDTIKSFIHETKQIPPKYSALKVNGKKLYELARKNIDVDIKEREIKIYEISDIQFYDDIEIINYELKKEYVNKIISFNIKVSSGTYIRSVVRDIGYRLNTFATMIKLNRLQIGKYTLNDVNKKISISTIYDENLTLNDDIIYKLSNGLKIKIEKEIKNEIINIFNNNNEFKGLVKIEQGYMKRYKYFNK